MRILDKIMQFIRRNPDKVDRVVTKVSDTVDRRTGGKYRSKIDRGREFARRSYGGGRNQAPGTGRPPRSDDPPAPRREAP